MCMFELTVLLKAMDRPETVTALKRVGTMLINKGGVIKTVESLGAKNLPFRMKSEEITYTMGTYFLYQFHCNTAVLKQIADECSKDTDVLRAGVAKIQEFTEECTLEEEFQPPALRKSVQDLLEMGKKNKGYQRPKPHEKKYNFFDIHM